MRIPHIQKSDKFELSGPGVTRGTVQVNFDVDKHTTGPLFRTKSPADHGKGTGGCVSPNAPNFVKCAVSGPTR